MVQWFIIKRDLLNPGLNYWFSSGQKPNLEPNLGSVQFGSGSNHGSELSLTITSQNCCFDAYRARVLKFNGVCIERFRSALGVVHGRRVCHLELLIDIIKLLDGGARIDLSLRRQ